MLDRKSNITTLPRGGLSKPALWRLNRDRRAGPSGAASLIVRDLHGSIAFWDHGSESCYGFSKHQAIGSVSHRLLQTIFPSPLNQINEELLAHEIWEGELIHTIRDGTRVKVLSRWELHEDKRTSSFCVREINTGFLPIEPEISHLAEPSFNGRNSWSARLRVFCRQNLVWIVGPALVIGAGFFAVWLLTHELPLVPLKLHAQP